MDGQEDARPARTVRHDATALLGSPLLTGDLVASISGYALRLETGLVETVVEDER